MSDLIRAESTEGMRVLFLGLVGLVLIESWPSAQSHLASPALPLERVAAAWPCAVKRSIDGIVRKAGPKRGEAWGSMPRTGLRLRGGGGMEGHDDERICLRRNGIDAIRGGSGQPQGTVYNCGMSLLNHHVGLHPSSPSPSTKLMHHFLAYSRHERSIQSRGRCLHVIHQPPHLPPLGSPSSQSNRFAALLPSFLLSSLLSPQNPSNPSLVATCTRRSKCYWVVGVFGGARLR